MKHIYYTDGSTKNNGKTNASGGYGIVEVDENDNIIWQFQDTKKPTTNNEMELMAILKALERISTSPEAFEFIKPIIYSDSAYCVNIINDWMYRWKANGWKRPKNEEIKNLEIIKQIYELAKYAEIRKVSGHSGIKWNEYVDGLATERIKI